MQWTWDAIHIIWLSGVALHIVLLAVLFACGRIRRFPFFTLLVFFYIVRSLAIMVTASRISHNAYQEMGLSLAFFDFLLEVLVLFGLAWKGLKGAGFKPQVLIPGCVLGLGVAACLPIFWGPWPALVMPGSPDFSWLMLASLITNKGNLFAQALALVTALAVLLASRRTGLRWTSHVRRILQGLSAYAIVAISSTYAREYLEKTLKPTTMAEYTAAVHKLNYLIYAPTMTYFLVVMYWIVTLWMADGSVKQVATEAPAE